jgi:hypothetical protein
MIRIAITVETFEAIKATLPVGSVAFAANAETEFVLIWLESRWLNRLRAIREARATTT